MNKLLVVIGIILLLTGMVTISYSLMPEDKVSYEEVNKKIKSYEVSGNFSKGDKIVVLTEPNKIWANLAIENFKNYPPRFLRVNYSIIDPFGKETRFGLIYCRFDSQYGDPKIAPFAVQLIFNDGALEVNATSDGYVPEVGGIALVSGEYTVRILQTVPEPSFISLLKETHSNIYPWSFLLPIGITITAAGGASLPFAARKGKTSQKRKIRTLPKTKLIKKRR